VFTGIIEEIGKVKQIARRGQTMVLTISAKLILSDVHLGDSIAINGVCLTVVSCQGNEFTVEVMPETFRQTNLKLLGIGENVNLERAMSAQGRFGGHIVQGHVDCIGTIVERQPYENAVVYRIKPADSAVLKYMIPRGSITLDGISLTIVEVAENTITVSIIPHTLAQTVLGEKRTGAVLNIECDVLGKYIERLLGHRTSGITEQLLSKQGFI